jgi:hypothetical protein
MERGRERETKRVREWWRERKGRKERGRDVEFGNRGRGLERVI